MQRELDVLHCMKSPINKTQQITIATMVSAGQCIRNQLARSA